VEQSITIRNPTKIPCQVKTKARYHGYSVPGKIDSEYKAAWVFIINQTYDQISYRLLYPVKSL